MGLLIIGLLLLMLFVVNVLVFLFRASLDLGLPVHPEAAAASPPRCQSRELPAVACMNRAAGLVYTRRRADPAPAAATERTPSQADAVIRRGEAMILGGQQSSVAALLSAIRQVESGGASNPPDGDQRRAIGPYQIHHDYWADARVPGTYQDCRGEAYARRVVLAYWTRYAKDWRPETLARIHNGGPRGAERAATRGYWVKVKAAMGDGA